MSYRVDNAVILAAGFASRFVPLSYEKPKALIEVKGEVLIERQIRQLFEAGINDVYIVVGHKKDDFKYLQDKFGVKLIINPDYKTVNNVSSIYAARNIIGNTYICSSDNYFSINPFSSEVEESCYSVIYSEGPTDEWCVECDENDYITGVKVGGCNEWYMLGHVFWDEEFSKTFINLLSKEYGNADVNSMLWESFYLKHIDKLPMKVQKHPEGCIFEFDNLEELRKFDGKYLLDSGSAIMKGLTKLLNCAENELHSFSMIDSKSFVFKYIDTKFTCYLDGENNIQSIK